MEILSFETGEGNSEFIFRNAGAQNWWDDVIKARSYYLLDKKAMKHADGQMWRIELPELAEMANQPGKEKTSKLTLTENDKMLPFYATLSQIAHAGEGRYCHLEKQLYFSSTDRSNPASNNYEYAYWLEESVSGV